MEQWLEFKIESLSPTKHRLLLALIRRFDAEEMFEIWFVAQVRLPNGLQGQATIMVEQSSPDLIYLAVDNYRLLGDSAQDGLAICEQVLDEQARLPGFPNHFHDQLPREGYFTGVSLLEA